MLLNEYADMMEEDRDLVCYMAKVQDESETYRRQNSELQSNIRDLESKVRLLESNLRLQPFVPNANVGYEKLEPKQFFVRDENAPILTRNDVWKRMKKNICYQFFNKRYKMWKMIEQQGMLNDNKLTGYRLLL